MVPYTNERGLRDYHPRISNEPTAWRWGWYLLAVIAWLGFGYVVLTRW